MGPRAEGDGPVPARIPQRGSPARIMNHPHEHGHGAVSDPIGDDEILAWLLPLDGVLQDPEHHPERDALYHSLQVFERALADRAEAELLAAALLHDVGKAYGGRD